MTAAVTLGALYDQARPELARLGDVGLPLLDLVGVVERVGGGRGSDALTDRGFVLDVLAAASPGTDAALLARVLDFPHSRDGITAGSPVSSSRTV